ncbi:MAG TPA: D-alanine--D-alanine ligase family protein [Anaerolineales bacterium]
MVENKLRIGVIFGGRSGEHEVSLMSARSVLAALDPAKYEVTQIGITHEGTWLAGGNVLDALLKGQVSELTPVLLSADPTRPGLYAIRRTSQGEALEYLTALDVVFPVLHGTFGEDGALQGLLELADLAYVGGGVLGSALGMDKGVFKDAMRANGIPVVESLVVLRTEIEKDMPSVISRAEQDLAYPLFVKPANLGSSVGISKCQSRSDLLEGLLEATRFDRRVLVERGVNGREIEVSVVGNDNPQASVPGEILPSREFYSYEAKYVDGSSGLLIPAPISAEIEQRARDLAVRAYRAIDCAGMARVDFLLDKDTGELFLNEINTIPGFTEISMYPKLWETSGLPYPALIDRLVELALERKAERDATERRYRRGS